MLKDLTFLITGIADENSLAMKTATTIIENGGKVVCSGLGVTPFHKNLSEKAEEFLNKSYNDFEVACKKVLGNEVYTLPLDVTLQESLDYLSNDLKEKNIKLNGFLHAIAMDKTIRKKSVKPMLEVTPEEFSDTMSVSAFSLVTLSSALLKTGVLQNGASIVSLSYIAAEKVSFFPYINISISKAALERLTIKWLMNWAINMEYEPMPFVFLLTWEAKAGNATLKVEDVERANRISPWKCNPRRFSQRNSSFIPKKILELRAKFVMLMVDSYYGLERTSHNKNPNNYYIAIIFNYVLNAQFHRKP
ncbi:MAG: SDR family oxidoreductase [Saprospiraceae bacterium]